MEPWKFAQTWIPPYGNAQTLHKPITNSLPQPNFFDGIAFAAMLAKYKFNAAQKHLDPVWPFLLSCFCLCPTWFSISIFLGISGSSDAVSSVGSGSAASQLNQLGTSSSSSMSKQIISQLQQDAANLSKMTGSNSSLAGIRLETANASSEKRVLWIQWEIFYLNLYKKYVRTLQNKMRLLNQWLPHCRLGCRGE